MELVILPFFSPLSSKEFRDTVNKSLKNSNSKIITKEEITNFDSEYFAANVLMFFIGTGGTENLIAEFIETFEIKSPIRLLTYKLANSLPAALELKKYLESQ